MLVLIVTFRSATRNQPRGARNGAVAHASFIPARIPRYPSDQRRKARMGPISTIMGDLMGTLDNDVSLLPFARSIDRSIGRTGSRRTRAGRQVRGGEGGAAAAGGAGPAAADGACVGDRRRPLCRGPRPWRGRPTVRDPRRRFGRRRAGRSAAGRSGTRPGRGRARGWRRGASRRAQVRRRGPRGADAVAGWCRARDNARSFRAAEGGRGRVGAAGLRGVGVPPSCRSSSASLDPLAVLPLESVPPARPRP